MGFLDKIFGSYTDRELKKITPIAKSVMALEENVWLGGRRWMIFFPKLLPQPVKRHGVFLG